MHVYKIWGSGTAVNCRADSRGLPPAVYSPADHNLNYIPANESSSSSHAGEQVRSERFVRNYCQPRSQAGMSPPVRGTYGR